jgi:hypothetical protein
MSRIITDTFVALMPCEGTQRTFTTQSQREMFKRLHVKKCKICKNSLLIKSSKTTIQNWNETCNNIALKEAKEQAFSTSDKLLLTKKDEADKIP